MKIKKAQIPAAPYPVEISLIVSDDITRLSESNPFFPKLNDAGGAVIFQNRNFWIVLKRSELGFDVVAHECFHATHFILNHCNVKFRVKDHHEAYAYFNGYLNEAVHKQLKKWKIRIK